MRGASYCLSEWKHGIEPIWDVFISSISYVQLIVQARGHPLFPRKTVCYGIIHSLTPNSHDLTNLNPSLPVGAAPLLKVAINLEISH